MSASSARPLRINDFDARNDLFIDWILEDASQNLHVLDIGANNGKFCPEVERIFARASHVCGVDPDGAKLASNPFLHERYATTLEDAPLKPDSFDLLFSIYVAEHVEKPEEFMAAAHRVLKPGGAMYFLTPNANHYFAFIAGTLGRIGLQDRVLKMLLPREHVEEYHYPAVYRMNRPSRIDALARAAGFSKVEYRYSEHIQDLEVYFPRPLKFFPVLWQKAARATGRETMLCNLMVKVVK